MRYSGEQFAFDGSEQNGIVSISFNSWFPRNFEFQKTDSVLCTDLSWYILAAMMLFLFGFAWFPKLSPLIMVLGLNTCGYWYVLFFADPPSRDSTALFASSLADVFIVWVATYALYKLAIHLTFADWGLLSLKDRALQWGLCYLIPFWTLVHLNYFSYIPHLVRWFIMTLTLL